MSDVKPTEKKLAGGSLWRRVAASTWDPPTQPTVYGKVAIDVTEILKYLTEIERKGGVKITLTCFFSWIIARTISKNKDINCIVRGGNLKQLPTVDVNLAVALPQSDQVWLCKMREADKLPLVEFAQSVANQVEQIKTQADSNLSESYNWVAEYAPASLIRRFISLFVSLETDWGIPTSWLGVPHREPFQPVSASISSVGALNVEEAYACFPTLQPTPLIFVLGAAILKPWVIDNGSIEARPVMHITCAADHRVVDGKLAASFLRRMEHMIEHTVGKKVFSNQPVSKL